MPSSDYASAIGGGLKLKGSAGSAGIDKKRKKKQKSKEIAVRGGDEGVADSSSKVLVEKGDKSAQDGSVDGSALQAALAQEDEVRSDGDMVEGDDSTLSKIAPASRAVAVPYKTEAQRKYEERRRQRLDERLRREGVQTHKERVEQLNKYLSGLSEHHDMPRIGPG